MDERLTWSEVSFAVVGGPVGLLLAVLWPGVGGYLRRVGRAVRLMLPGTVCALWFAARWFLWALRVAVAWLFWAARLALRIVWGPG